jgi:hypothetical protein
MRDTAKDALKTVQETRDNIVKFAAEAKGGNITYIAIGICGVILFSISMWVYSKFGLDDSNCQEMETLYKDFPTISSINFGNDNYKYPLRDYYVKTAYNACCSGTFKNDFVNICALKSCIKQGARCLDLGVYSIDGEPVIATSSVDNFAVKETYNSVPFAKVIDVINDYAFSGTACPCPNDPVILHLRIMTNKKEIYSKMADEIYNKLETRLLGPSYSYENHGKNLGKMSLSELQGKVIIIVDKSNARFEGTPFDEYVNLASNSIFMRSIRYTSDVKLTPDSNELKEYNKKNMTICLPDLSVSPSNPSSLLSMSYGCQFVAMSFQKYDSNMEYYDKLFDKNNSAFILKEEKLRYIPVTIAAPPKANPMNSYKDRTSTTAAGIKLVI